MSNLEKRQQGTQESLKSFSRKDVETFFSTYYRPNNAIFAIVGDVKPAEIMTVLQKYFGGWTQGEVPPAVIPKVTDARPSRIYVIDRPGSVQTNFLLGTLTVERTDPDFPALSVANRIIGGGPSARLFMNLREAKNYATYAFTEMEVFGSCGIYWARALVKPESIVPAVREIQGEIGALATGPAVPSEIEEAKSYLVGSLPLRFESSAGFGEWMARYIALGLDQSQWDKGPEELKRVDAERVREAAKRYLAAAPVVVIVGSPEWLGPYLGDFDTVEVYDTFGQLKHVQRK